MISFTMDTPHTYQLEKWEKNFIRKESLHTIKDWVKNLKLSRCLKITEKVPFNIVSEASYIYILSGQKFTDNVKNGPIRRVFANIKFAVKQSSQTSQF